MPGCRSTAAETLERVKFVEKLLLDGEPRANLLEIVTQKYGVTDHQVGFYITDAYKRITAINKVTIDENRGWILRNLISIYQEARSDKDHTNSLKALKQISELTGVEYQPAANPRDLKELPDEALERDWHQEAVLQ